MKKSTIYLDYAAATPLDAQVKAAMEPYYTDNFYNPSATYLAAKSVASDIQDARASIAHYLGSRPNEIVFTAGGTEANNLAISGIMKSYPDSNVVISSIEHESIVKPAEQFNVKSCPVNKKGLINLEELEKIIDDQTVLVSVMYANNEIGTIQPLLKISKIISKIQQSRRKINNSLPLYFHTDACQVPAFMDLHVSRLGVDLMTLNSGKIYGPKQFGCLYVGRKVELLPVILGGGQERGFRSGTENPSNIIGFAKALSLVQENKTDELKRLSVLRDYFISQLIDKFPTVLINGSVEKRLPNNIHATFPGKDNEELLMRLDELGILCASGSACSASNEEVSVVLTAIGLSEVDARSSLRFTLGKFTTKKDLDYVIGSLIKIL